MKNNFTLKFANSPFDDTAIFVRNVHMRRAVLLDCGKLGSLENSDLNDLSDVFVTHTHMDHFTGFDRFLRSCLLTGNTVRFYGPEGFIANVRGKLQSYNWNLIRDYSLTFDAIELTPNGNKHAKFSTKSSFVYEGEEDFPSEINLNDGFKLQYDFFDHGIPVIGYRITEPQMISIDKDALKTKGFVEGVWLKEFKSRLLNHSDNDDFIETDTKDGKKIFKLNELENSIAKRLEPQSITYITDIAPSEDNCSKASKLAYKSNLLIIEAVFMDKDIEHAKVKKHLSTGLSKKIFFDSKSEKVRFLHFSSRNAHERIEFFRELNSGMQEYTFNNKVIAEND